MKSCMRIFFLLLIIALEMSSQELPEWQRIPIREDLYQYRINEIEQELNFDELNRNVTENILAFQPAFSEKRAPGISYDHALEFMNQLKSEDFFINSKKKYDPDGNLGLCFGRAIYLHLLMLKYGVNKDSIKKIFAVGTLESSGSKLPWQFHVATIVKSDKLNSWWVLDTVFGKPMPIEEWVDQIKRLSQDRTFRLFRKALIDRTKSLRIYITEAQKIGPNGWEYNVNPGGLYDPVYNNYFRDMFNSLKRKNIPKESKLNYKKPLSCRELL